MRSLLVVPALILSSVCSYALLTGCAEMNVTTKDKIITLARQYGDDVRWGRIEVASQSVGMGRRPLFIERHKSLEEDLEFADFELLDVEVDAKRTTALARVDYTWTRRSQGLVKKTTTEQKWEYVGMNWVMTKESRLRGAPLVLFDEPAKKTAAIAAPRAE